MKNEELRFRVDLRKSQIETREVREGNKMSFQCRINIINLDDSVEYGEWLTTVIIENYGDCFDKKPSLFSRLLGLIGNNNEKI